MIFTSFDEVPAKTYGVVYADPPWRFRAYAPPKPDAKNRRDTERHYPTMTIADIKALDVKRVASRNCWLVMWTSWPFLPQALEVMSTWGFRYSSSFKVWVKTKRSLSPDRVFLTLPQPYAPNDFHTGTGYTTRKNIEFCLLGRRGSPKRLAKNVHELLVAPVREHSRKPDGMHPEIARFAAGPYLEMFARCEIEGWDHFGNQVDRFEAPKPAPVAEQTEEEQPALFDMAVGA